VTRRLHGVVGAPVTPFKADGEVDAPCFETLLSFLVETKVDAISLPMHIGESLSLTNAERRRLVEIAAHTVAGEVPLLVHVSCAGTAETVELARHAARNGAEGVIVLTPYYWKPPRRGLADHFAQVAASVDIGLVAYNSPTHTGVEIPLDLIEHLLVRFENLVAVKDASFNFEYFTELCRITHEVRPQFSVFTGVEHLLPSTAVGGAGCFSAAGGVAPVLIRRLFDACRAGVGSDALQLQYQFSCLYRRLQVGYPATIKAAMGLMGRPVGATRPPLPTLDTRELAELGSWLEAMPFLEDEPRGWTVPSRRPLESA